MISYAQNFEDVILERLFKKVERGFYVDVGACHPVYDSVTHHFYLKEWRGVNVEPQLELFSKLLVERPRDINLNVCIGAEPGKKKLYITSAVGTSTINSALGKSYRSTGKVVQEIEVSVITLNELWLQNIKDDTVNFLKIDIEGMEKQVLQEADFSFVAPQVIIVEAVHPETLMPTEGEWEHYLRDHYKFFYFDGLNRFYRRNNFLIDEKNCSIPPNVFDGFVTYKEHVFREAYERLSSERDSGFFKLKNLRESLVSSIRKLALRR